MRRFLPVLARPSKELEIAVYAADPLGASGGVFRTGLFGLEMQ